MCVRSFFSFYLKDEVKRSGETGVEETILEGHIGVTKELLAFQTAEKKYYIGCEKGGANLIKVNFIVYLNCVVCLVVFRVKCQFWIYRFSFVLLFV